MKHLQIICPALVLRGEILSNGTMDTDKHPKTIAMVKVLETFVKNTVLYKKFN